MNRAEIIGATENYVKQTLQNAEGGHDWWHMDRVRKNALSIAKHENGANLFVVEVAALLHDIADAKFHEGDETIGPQKAKALLESLHVPAFEVGQVVSIVENISFKNTLAQEGQKYTSLELDIVQDADRLDAIGAIGIARTFNYGGFKNREIYHPEIPPNLQQSKEEYKKSTAPTINHFYEKLLLLKDLMKTDEGKRRAKERHRFMELYLAQFYKEWEGES